MMLRDLQYAWPWAAKLALLIPVFALLLWLLYRYRKKVLHSGNFIFISRSRLYYLLQGLFLLIAWLAGMVALMQPLANGHYPEGRPPASAEAKLRRPAHEVVLLVDASASMAVADMHNGQTRLQFANQLADEFVSGLEGEQVSLYAFTGELSPLSPPTLDYLFVRLMLDQIGINQDGTTGTDYYAALIELRKYLLQTPVTTLKSVIILTDGVDTSIDAAPASEKNKLESALLKLVDDYLKLNARIYTIGFGTSKGGIVPDVSFEGKPVVAKLNQSLLKQMAGIGHGKFLNANDYTALDAAQFLAEEVNGLSTGAQGQDINNTVEIGQEKLIYTHYFQYPLAVAIIALLLALYLPEVRAASLAAGFIGMFSWSTLHGDAIRPAEILFEASEFAKSAGVLEQMTQSKLKEWQAQTLLYNKGTIYLAQEEWDLAITTFMALTDSDDMPPPLSSAININLGIAFLEKAHALAALNPAPYEIMLTLQSQAMAAFAQAESSEMPNADAARLARLAAIAHAKTVQSSIDWALTASPVQQALPLLLLNLSNLELQIRFLDREWVDAKLKDQYVRLISEEQTLWDSLWNRQQENWEFSAVDTVQQTEALRFFKEAYAEYQLTLKEVNSSSWQESLHALEEASLKLSSAMRLQFSGDPLQELYQRLLSSYKRLLGQKRYSAGALLTLKKEQEQFMEAAKGNELMQSTESLTAAVSAFQQGELQLTTFYLENAQEGVRRALFNLQVPTAQHILEDAIAQQAFAGRMLLLRLQLNDEKNLPPAYWEEGQETVLLTAKRFLPTVLEQQTKAYRGSGPNRCQARPWDEVLTLFEKGRREAVQAVAILKEGGLTNALPHEGRAVVAWQQALAALKKPVIDTSSPCQSSAQPKQSNEGKADNEESAPSQPQAAGAQDVLRILQELNEEDQLPKTDRGIKKGLRPW